MDRIHTPAIHTAAGATAEIYAQIRSAIGNVPNSFAAIGAHAPEALKTVLAADSVLTAGRLGMKEIETIKLTVSEAAGCDYCVAAHTLRAKLAGLSPAEVREIRTGKPIADTRRDALARLVRTLVTTSGTIPESQFVAIKAAGYTDSQLVEISLAIAVTVFTNVFNRINDTAIDFPAVA